MSPIPITPAIRAAFAEFNSGVARAREDYQRHPFRYCRRNGCTGIRDDDAIMCADHIRAYALERARVRRKRGW